MNDVCVVAVDGLDLELVGELDPRHRDRVLADLHHAPHGGGDGRERARGGRVAAGMGWMRSVALADQAERALRPDHQPRQVIAGR